MLCTSDGVHGISVTRVSGPTLNFQKSQDLVTKNHKIEQKFPSYIENARKWHENGENEKTFTLTI